MTVKELREKRAEIVKEIRTLADTFNEPDHKATDGPEHPRRVLANNVGYFQTHRHPMDYPTYRRKGWPSDPASRSRPSNCSTSA